MFYLDLFLVLLIGVLIAAGLFVLLYAPKPKR